MVIVLASVTGYFVVPKTVHFYGLNDYPLPFNVTVDVDGIRIIKGAVPQGSKGIDGMVVKSVRQGVGSRGVKCTAVDFNITDDFTLANFGDKYMFLLFMSDGISMDVQDRQPVFI